MTKSVYVRTDRWRAKWEPIAADWAIKYRSGMTLKEIAAIGGVSSEYVRQILAEIHDIKSADGGGYVSSIKRSEARAAKRNARYLDQFGCTVEQYESIREKVAPVFTEQRRNAAKRGIPWELNIWEWWIIWRDSGHWHERGPGAGYAMCRKGDVGPYSKDNVFIASGRINSSQGNKKNHKLPIGVSLRGAKYRAFVCLNGKRKYLGRFDTPEEARAAYVQAVAASERGPQ